jgi:Fe2+ or Zn2+ uptake regulation protein
MRRIWYEDCDSVQDTPVLRELDLIQELNFPKGQARFDSYMKPQINLICLQCDNITDLDDLTTREIANRVAAATKFKPNGQRIDVGGICQKCSYNQIEHSLSEKSF